MVVECIDGKQWDLEHSLHYKAQDDSGEELIKTRTQAWLMRSEGDYFEVRWDIAQDWLAWHGWKTRVA